METVEKYRKRREKRLAARGFRLDDDDAENGGGGKRGGGHGNTKIPYGLCQREGIKVDPSWTPKDAWDALAGKGYSAGEVYESLKKTGKVGEKKSKEERVGALKDKIAEIQARCGRERRNCTVDELRTVGKMVIGLIEKPKEVMITEKMKERDFERRTKLIDKVNDLEIYLTNDGKIDIDDAKDSPELRKYQRLCDELEDMWCKYELEQEKRSREAVKNAISSFRSVGMGDNKLRDIVIPKEGFREMWLKDLKTAFDCFPTDWVTAMKTESETFGKLAVFETGRGYFDLSGRNLALSGRGVGEHATTTAIHETGHFIEWSVPGIKKDEKAFYEYRTKGQKSEPLGKGYEDQEVTKRDHFIDPYMGKDYGGQAYELVSMGFEKVFTDYERFHKQDPEMCEWILGLFAMN